jgi:signal transduction histidine kinase
MNSFCPWDPAQYLIFSSNVPSILYYALIPGMVTAILFSLLIVLKNKHNVSARILFYISLSFLAWGLFSLILFATNNPNQVMFFWSLTILVEPLIYLLSLFFAQNFLYSKSFNFKKFILLIVVFLPVIVFLPTKMNLIGVNLSDCTATEGPIALYYTYALEVMYSIVILWMAIYKYKHTENKEEKKEVIYFTFGIALFLITFSSGNIIGSFTDNWTASLYGYFGMPIFMGILAYIVVKYKAFNIKVLAAQALVAGLAILIGSQFLFTTTLLNNVLNSIAFVAVIVFGRLLVKSVEREVRQKEQLEILSNQLEVSNEELGQANEKLKGLDKLKTEFLSLASHQLRSPLTAIKGYASMVKDGDFGEIAPKAKEAVERIFDSSQNLTMIVEDLLNVSKIESGGMRYEKINFDMSEIVKTTAQDLSIMAGKKNIKLTYSEDNGDHTVLGDKEKLRQVVLNFIDNSIKYTKEGTIEVKLENKNDKVLVSVKDTGMGVSPEIMATLFQKFARGEGQKMNTGGSGLGLYLAKEIVDAHKGRVWVESPGMGLGSTFFIELDDTKI